MYRLLVAVPTRSLATDLRALSNDELAGGVTVKALEYLRDMFAAGPTATGSAMAGRPEQGVGEPEIVASSCAVLATELLDAISGSDGAARAVPLQAGFPPALIKKTLGRGSAWNKRGTTHAHGQRRASEGSHGQVTGSG